MPDFSLKHPSSRNQDLLYFALIIVISAGLRFWSISYGLPATYNSTEYFLVKHALSLGARKTLEPLYFIYPTFYLYFLAILYGLYFLIGAVIGWFAGPADFAVQFLLHPEIFYLLGRAVSAVCIITSAVIVYKSCRIYLSSFWAFLVTLIFINSLTIFDYTFWMVPDAFLVLGTSLVCYFILKGFRERLSKREIIFASLLSGVTVSSKYNAGFLALGWLVYIYFFSTEDKRFRIPYTLLAFAMLMLGFFIGSPFWILSFSKFWTGFRMIVSQAQYAYNFENSIPYWWEIRNIITNEWLFGLIILAIMIFWLFKPHKYSIPFIAMVWPTFLYVGSWKKKGLDYLLIIFPVIIIYLAIWIKQYSGKEKIRRWMFLGLWLVVLLNFPRMLYKNFLYSQPDTRQLASDWIIDHYPDGGKICYDHHHYDLNIIDLDRFLTYGEGSKFLDSSIKEKLRQQAENYPGFQFISPQKILPASSLDDSIYAAIANDSFLVQAFRHPHKSLKELVMEGTELLILNSETYLKYLKNTAPSPGNPLRMDFIQRQHFYRQILDSLSAIKVFEPSLRTPGPTLHIYEVRRP